jgi:1,4-alpha-glucan branching enzyme
MGAVLHEGGCTFRCWAPNADSVWVAGDWTNPDWDGGKIALARDSNDPSNAGFRYWSGFVPGVGVGREYRFVVQNNGLGPGNPVGAPLISHMDPYCRDATSSEGNSLTADQAFDWGPNTFQMPNWNEMVVYELHIGTFNRQGSRPGMFAEAVGKLDYLRDLAVNALELMPAEDFDTETSMGYNPSLPFAIDDAYGRSKAVQAFVKAAHDRQLAVVVDVVYNHYGPEGLGASLWQFDGWSLDGFGGIYLYNDGRASCPWGEKNRPDFGRSEVQQYIRDNAMMWLHEYRADGLRLDSVVNVRKVIDHDSNDRGDNPAGWALLQWINGDKNRELPWTITIAEDLQNNDWVTKTTGAGGAGFDAQWDSRFRDAVRNAVIVADDSNRDMGALGAAIGKSYNQSGMFQRIIYVESHDEAHQQRLPEAIWPGNAAGWHARKRSTLAAAVVLTSPGIPMIFQGQEFLEWGSWNDQQALDWSKAGTFSGIHDLYRDLIKLRRNWYNNTRGLRGENINIFHVNYEDKVIAYHRWMDGGAGDDVVVVANFSTFPRPSYNIGFPREGTWYLRFNSDWSAYSGDFGNVGYDTTAAGGGNQGMPFNGNVGLGAYSAIVLSQ